ncbi:hypothetical protein Ddye_031611 [Dipteronia dyeriana]|uniref:Uncharacterized protein n=1 Tax=Dipteronia dyeriana TaxID=168575 RepID=A0AAD9TIN5_9ROSI|nr:hypothetical protein Ddye_031611 [Dipteronia dyeriana]
MDTGGNYQKQRGFMKSKLARNFSRGLFMKSKQASSKISGGSATNCVSYNLSVHHHQDLQNSSSMQKVAALSTANNKPNSYGCFDYGGYGGDENVDTKATDFIFCVQERFKQDRQVDSSNAF